MNLPFGSKRAVNIVSGIATLYVVLSFSVCAFADETDQGKWPPRLGELFPDLDLIDSEEMSHLLSSFRGKVILLQFIDTMNYMDQLLTGVADVGPFRLEALDPITARLLTMPQAKENNRAIAIESCMARIHPAFTLAEDRIVWIQVVVQSDQKQAKKEPGEKGPSASEPPLANDATSAGEKSEPGERKQIDGIPKLKGPARALRLESSPRGRATAKDVRDWKDHFSKVHGGPVHVFGLAKSPPRAMTDSSFPLLHVIDRDFVLRRSLIGYSGDLREVMALLKTLPELLDQPPDQPPALDPHIVRKIAAMHRENPTTPLPRASDALYRNMQPQRQAFLSKLLGEAYLAHGQRNEQWDDRVLQFLDVFGQVLVPYEFPSHGSPPGIAEGVSAAEQAIQMGCRDPLVAGCLALLLTDPARAKERASRLREAVDGFAISKYPATTRVIFRPLLALLTQQGLLDPQDRSGAEDRWRQAMNDAVQASTECDRTPFNRQFLLTRILAIAEQSFPTHRWEVAAAMSECKSGDPWLRHQVIGILHINQAWQERGRGSAATVSPQGWQGFERNLEAAAAHLITAWDIDPTMEGPAAAMISVAMGGVHVAGESARFWFDRAVEARFDHLEAYSNMLWCLRPRWHGSHEEMLDFGRECLATERFDTWVPHMFLIALRDVASEYRDPNQIYRDKENFELARSVFEKMLADPTWNDHERNALQSQWVAFAWAAGHDDLARTALRELNGKLDPQAVSVFHMKAEDIIQALTQDQHNLGDKDSGPRREL